MALDMTLELEGDHPDWEAVKEAAIRTGATGIDVSPERKRVHFVFSNSLTGVRLYCVDDLRPIAAEGKHGCKFLTKYTLVMRINNSRYDESIDDMYQFLRHLSELSKMQFVFSFQYEDVRAIRNEAGFEYFLDKSR